MSESEVASFYAGKNLFISGGSGFLGLGLIEKLLRSVPDIGTVYLMLRPKRGKEIGERLEELKKNLVFEKLLESRSSDEVFSRLKAVAGDVSQPNLGLSPEDRQTLTANVNVIIHSAATLDFADGLKTTVDINLLGTRRMLELASQCRNLTVFVHVSSAYVNSWRLDCEEIIYPLTHDPEEIIELASSKPEKELDAMTPKILGDHPNTYTFTKQMAEHEVQKHETKFPCTIVRPSMIIGACKEPVPGWTISKNGPQGFLMGAAKGVVRRLPVGKRLIYDYIPVDTVINNLIVAGFHAGSTKAKQVEVYHCTTSTRNPFMWEKVMERVDMYLHSYPLKSAVWYPTLKFLPSITLFKISAIFVHFLPALLLDTVTRLSGGRPILMRLHKNVNASLNRLEKFIFTEWRFHAKRTDELHNSLSETDKSLFSLDIRDIIWDEYFIDLTKGVRRYLNKEKITNLSAAKRKDNLLLVFHLMYQAMWYSLVWYLFATLLGTTMSRCCFIVPLSYYLFSYL